MSRDILSEIDTSGEIAIWVAVTINAVLTRADNRLNGQGDARHWIDDADNGFFEAVADDAGFSAERLRQRIWDELARSAGARSVFAQRIKRIQAGNGRSGARVSRATDHATDFDPLP